MVAYLCISATILSRWFPKSRFSAFSRAISASDGSVFPTVRMLFSMAWGIFLNTRICPCYLLVDSVKFTASCILHILPVSCLCFGFYHVICFFIHLFWNFAIRFPWTLGNVLVFLCLLASHVIGPIPTWLNIYMLSTVCLSLSALHTEYQPRNVTLLL